MMDIADLRLEKPEAPPAAQHRGRLARVLPAAIITIVLAAPAAYPLWPRRLPAPASVRVQTQEIQPRTHAEPVAVPAADIVVPPLDETDPLVRQLVSALSTHPTVTAWLATDNLIRNFALVTLNIAEGRSPSKQLRAIKPTGVFTTVNEGAAEYIDPGSYQRYNRYADAIAALDPRAAARIYATLKPRITEAHRQLGDPDGDFDVTLTRAIVELLRTPIVDGRVALTHQSVNYEFADPALRSLSGAQRQFLRMGPRNMRLVLQKAREVAPNLGLDLTRSGT